MDWRTRAQLLKNPAGTIRWRLVLVWVAVLSGCQSGSIIKERTVLSMAGAIQTSKASAVVARGQAPEPDVVPEQTIDLPGALRLAGLDNPTIAIAEEVV